MLSRLLPLVALCATAQALDNGAADLPPLGWCSWQRYRCAIACNDSTSKDCFNERLIRDTADAMAASPLKAAGYEYVALDDCWQAPRRVNGHVVADPHRFPSGMKALADYVHCAFGPGRRWRSSCLPPHAFRCPPPVTGRPCLRCTSNALAPCDRRWRSGR